MALVPNIARLVSRARYSRPVRARAPSSSPGAVLEVMPLDPKSGTPGAPFNARLDELHVIDLAFTHAPRW